jgi:pimeloyl-ACP methyl ester carboxylesterase
LLAEGFDKEMVRCVLVMRMHGFRGSKTGAPMGLLSQLFVEQGYGVLRFDFDGYGESDGAQQDNTVPRMLEDAKAVWDHASSLPFVDKIVLLGHSQGGVVAGMFAGRLEKAGTPPAGLILMASASILKEFAKKGRFFSYRCNPANPPEYILSAQTLPIEEESSWFTGPVLLLHGSWDPIIPVSCSKQYAKWYRNCSLNIIRATGHVFLLRRGKLVRLLMDYLRQFSL